MPPLSVLIKPASSSCNLRCKYCFYYDIAEKRDVKNYGIMTIETLEAIVKKLLSESTGHCTFAFQGGEPTLAGLGFYHKLIEFQKRYNINNCKINNAIQTNGIVIDDDWAKFFADNNFLVGLSLDGPEEINNMNRVDASLDGIYNKVLKTVRLFNKYGVEYNILCVVTALTGKHAEKIYRFFKKQNFKYLQYIPCLDPYGVSRGDYTFSLTPELYAEFLKKTFDLWYADIKSGNIVSVRYFDNIIGIAAGVRPEACGMSGVCQCQFVIEADGSVYPCDFYVFDDYKIGNVTVDSFEKMFNSQVTYDFIMNSAKHPDECKCCKWYPLCRGGCRRDRDGEGNGTLNINYFCTAFKDFFEYATPKIIELSQMIRKG